MADEMIDARTGEIVPTNLFRTDNPDSIVAKATELAKALAGVIDRQDLYVRIGGRDHVKVEGWTLLGSMLGVFPICTWTREWKDDDGKLWGWEARVEARTREGFVVGAAEAMCTRSESTWRSRDDYALRSMAQTRATSKALRLPLGFVVAMAGYEATPAEEIPDTPHEPPAKPVRAALKRVAAPAPPPAAATQPEEGRSLPANATGSGTISGDKRQDLWKRWRVRATELQLTKDDGEDLFRRLLSAHGFESTKEITEGKGPACKLGHLPGCYAALLETVTEYGDEPKEGF